MKKFALIIVALGIVISAMAEFRSWTDRNGNSIEAEFVRKSGTEIILRDRQGKTHWVDPDKLSDEDQLYLNPPPPPPPPQRYRLTMSKSAKQNIAENEDADTITSTITYDFVMKVEVLTDDAPVEGLKGAIFIVGQDEEKNFVVLEKTEAPVEMVGDKKGRVEGAGCITECTKDDDHKFIKGVQYKEYIFVLYSSDGAVLEKRSTKKWLNDHAKALSLNVGDRFNSQLERVDKGN